MAKGAEVFNVANGTELTIFELGKHIQQITGSSSDVKLIESPKKRYDYEVERRVGSSEKLHSVTNFRPDTDIKLGLDKLYIEYYK